MGGVSPETCWASYKYGTINFDTLLHLIGFFCMTLNKALQSFKISGIACSLTNCLIQKTWIFTLTVPGEKYRSFRVFSNPQAVQYSTMFMHYRTPYSRIVTQFPTFYGTWRLIAVFTWAYHLSLSWARLIQSTTSILFLIHILILSSLQYLCLPVGLLLLGVPTKIPYAFHFLPPYTNIMFNCNDICNYSISLFYPYVL